MFLTAYKCPSFPPFNPIKSSSLNYITCGFLAGISHIVITACEIRKIKKMDDRDPSPASTTTNQCRRLRRHVVEEDHDTVTCTGKSCQSCTAGVIADCVAVCCCPCAVVDILALAFFKLPWAVARKCIRGRRKKKSKNKKSIMSSSSTTKRDGEETDGISEKGRGENGKSCGGESVLSSSPGTHGIGGEEEEANDDFSAEEVWLELYDEVGHMGFGRVSFTGIPFRNKGN